MRLRRRALLASVGATLATAGCLASPGDTGQPATTGEPDDQPPHTTTGHTSDHPTTTARFGDAPCPSFSDTDRTVCWHTRDDADVYLEPSTEWFKPVSGNDAVETMTFTLHNGSDGPIRLNPHAWAVKRQTDDGWEHVAPDAFVQPMVELDPGETFEWMLSTESHPTADQDRTLYPTVDLENGRHAFVVTAALGGLESSATAETSTETAAGTSTDPPTAECVALFDVTTIYADTGTEST